MVVEIIGQEESLMNQERGGFEEQSLGRWKGMKSTAHAEHTALHQTT